MVGALCRPLATGLLSVAGVAAAGFAVTMVGVSKAESVESTKRWEAKGMPGWSNKIRELQAEQRAFGAGLALATVGVVASVLSRGRMATCTGPLAGAALLGTGIAFGIGAWHHSKLDAARAADNLLFDQHNERMRDSGPYFATLQGQQHEQSQEQHRFLSKQ